MVNAEKDKFQTKYPQSYAATKPIWAQGIILILGHLVDESDCIRYIILTQQYFCKPKAPI